VDHVDNIKSIQGKNVVNTKNVC